MSSWHGGKGGDRRPTQISQEEEDLRWKLIHPDTTLEEKDEIKIKLQELKENEHKNRDK